MERIGYKTKAEKENIKYQAEVERYIDSLYEILSLQDPTVWREIMKIFNSVLYGNKETLYIK